MRGIERRTELFESRSCAVEEPLSGLGQADAPGRSKQQGHSDPGFKGADGLAYGRRRYSEIRGGTSETAVSRSCEERLDSLERPAPDCVVQLHSLSRLHPIQEL